MCNYTSDLLKKREAVCREADRAETSNCASLRGGPGVHTTQAGSTHRHAVKQLRANSRLAPVSFFLWHAGLPSLLAVQCCC